MMKPRFRRAIWFLAAAFFAACVTTYVLRLSFGPVSALSWNVRAIIAEGLQKHVAALTTNDLAGIHTLSLYDTDIPIVTLPKRLTSLQHYIPNRKRKITDADLVHLNRLPSLDLLSLKGSQVTDAGLEQLSKLSSLKVLGLPPQITDAGLVHLVHLSSLRCLILDGAKITDAGLVHLAKLTKLEYLSLHRTRITVPALQEFRHQKLPHCMVLGI